MKNLAKYMADTPVETVPSGKTTDCLVHGCPLPGVYRQTNDTSICCVHDEEDAKDWGDQTARIRNRMALFHLALDMTNAAPGEPMPPRAVEKIVSMGGPEVRGRTIRQCGADLKRHLVIECKGEKAVPKAVKERFDTWRSLRSVVRAA